MSVHRVCVVHNMDGAELARHIAGLNVRSRMVPALEQLQHLRQRRRHQQAHILSPVETSVQTGPVVQKVLGITFVQAASAALNTVIVVPARHTVELAVKSHMGNVHLAHLKEPQ